MKAFAWEALFGSGRRRDDRKKLYCPKSAVVPLLDGRSLLLDDAMSVFATYAVYFRTQRAANFGGRRHLIGSVVKRFTPDRVLGCAYFAWPGPSVCVAVRRMPPLELDLVCRVPERGRALTEG